MPNAEFWNERFAADSDSGTSLFAGEPNATIAKHVEAIRASFSEGETPRAIDLGSGRGRHTVWLTRSGWSTTALDFSSVGLEHTAAILDHEGLDAELVEGDLTQWNPEPSSFELVLASFIHLPPAQQHRLWEMVASALVPGGYLVSVSHHPDNQIHGPKNPELLYTAKDVVAAFGDTFEVIAAERDVVKRVEDREAVDTVVVLRKR
ncbi:class I SAM-dependent methyltransferase [Corynebacterium lactis]|nr:class I SAM-dependent methyltransferase [Corynebacterium lactis]